MGIYAIGNLGSKLITFLLVPLYTYFITDPAEFGYYDICLTAVFCLGPIISMQLSEGGFRFLIETKEINKQQSIVTFVYKSIFRNAFILSLLGICLSLAVDIKYLGYIISYGIVLSFYDVTNQLVRGLGHIKVYMASNIFNAFAIAVFSVLTIVILKWSVPGLFIANLLARITTLIWIEYRIHLLKKYFSPKNIEINYSRNILKYSLPLLPMILLWWGLNSNNIFFIKHFLGLEENGIYAVLAKFSGILFILTNIFYQTWQQNAIEQYNSPDRDQLFSRIFNNYMFVLCAMIALFPYFLRLNYPWLVGTEYQSSCQYLFLNSLYVMTFSLSAFYEVQYQCAKQTSRILPSVIIAFLVNISLNYILTKPFGINGIIASNIATYCIIIIYRAIDTRRYVRLKFDNRNFLYLLGMAVSGINYYLYRSVLTDLIAIIVISIIFITLAPKSLIQPLKTKLANKVC